MVDGMRPQTRFFSALIRVGGRKSLVRRVERQFADVGCGGVLPALLAVVEPADGRIATVSVHPWRRPNDDSRSIRSGVGRWRELLWCYTSSIDNVARAQADTMKPVVIVAGVGPGIGTSIARAFGAEGFAIALLARDSARLAKRHAEITAAGITAAPFIVDLADSAATLRCG